MAESTELIQAGFQTLVESWIPAGDRLLRVPARGELIVDQIYESGISYMLYSVSDTAEYGAYYAGPKVIDAHVRAAMQELLDRIQDGTFAKQWIAENESGREQLPAERADRRTAKSSRSARVCAR